ncbi:MAG: 6-phosphogluconolactonase [Longimicrobiales bacterium]
MNVTPELHVFDNADELARGTADLFVAAAARAIAHSGSFRAALSGGSTPRLFLRMLATSAYASQVDWRHVHLFWGDERCVPPSDAASNFRMARQALIDHVPIPASQVHRMEGELDPGAAAAEYDALLRREFTDGVTRFDLTLLGLGDNGHTASLFPGGTAVREAEHLVVAEFIEEVQASRITLTPTAINASAEIAFVVCGSDKARMVRRVIERSPDIDAVPATAIMPVNGRLVWLLDDAAAAHLEAI